MDHLILIRGELTNEEVYNDDGHGCLIIERSSKVPFVNRPPAQSNGGLNPYCAVPYMMLTGCFGLVRAFAQRVEMWREEMKKRWIIEDEYNRGAD